MSSDDEVALIEAVLAEVPGARERLLATWVPVVLQWCNRMGGPTVDADDAAQDVFVVVLTKLHALRDRSRFQPWLYGVTRRVLAKHRRRGWVKRWAGEPSPTVEAAGQAPDEAAALSEAGERVRAALEQLSQAHREVLVLCDCEGRSATEAGRLLDIPTGTVKSRLRAARKNFRALAEQADLQPVVGVVP